MKLNRTAKYWTVGMLLRWSITSAILVCLTDYCVLQIASLLIISVVFQAVLIIGSPYIK
jgi:hypothetical protein